MAWAALVPVAMQVLGAMTKKDEPAPAAQMPPPPSLGEIFASNSANAGKDQGPTQFSSPQTNPFSPIPVGGSSRGSNG